MNEPEAIVPLISSSVMGPLGVRHLPRLWSKILLDAAGRLPAGYRSGIGGFDRDVCEAVGVDAATFTAFVRAERPFYEGCEAWIRRNTRGLDHVRIARFNDYVITRDLDDERASKRRDALGIFDDTLKRAVSLNDLEDWHAFHAAVTNQPLTEPVSSVSEAPSQESSSVN